MTEGTPDDQLASLNQVLSDCVDVAVTARQARHAAPGEQQLHAELERLFASARSWAEQLVELDNALGVSALDYMASPTGRLQGTPRQPPPSDEEIRRTLRQQLGQLAARSRAMLAQREDERVREVMERISAELQEHLDALAEP